MRIVPYDTGTGNSYNLDILNEIVNIDDAIADRDVLDRSTVDCTVNADPTYSPVEIREVATGGAALTPTQDDRLRELWQILGLDPANAVTNVPTSITFGGVTITVSGDGETTSTLTRQP